MLDERRTFLKKNKGDVIFIFGIITVFLIVSFLLFHNFAINTFAKISSYFLLLDLYIVIVVVSASFGVMWNILRRDLKDVPSARKYFGLVESWMLFPPLITTSFTLNIAASRNFAEVYRAQSPEMPFPSYVDTAGYSQFLFYAPTPAMWIVSVFVYLLCMLFFIVMFKRHMRVPYEKPFYDSNGNLFFGRQKKLNKSEFKRYAFFLIWLVMGLLNVFVAISFLRISELHAKSGVKAELDNDLLIIHCTHYRAADEQTNNGREVNWRNGYV